MSATSSRPSAIWTAFAAQGRWKNYVLAGQLLLQGLLIVVMLKVARTEPSVVVVDESGEGHFVERGVATQALLAFLADQKGAPSALTLESFSKRFLRVASAPNSSPYEMRRALLSTPASFEVAPLWKADSLHPTRRLEDLHATWLAQMGAPPRVSSGAAARLWLERSRILTPELLMRARRLR